MQNNIWGALDVLVFLLILGYICIVALSWHERLFVYRGVNHDKFGLNMFIIIKKQLLTIIISLSNQLNIHKMDITS